MCVIAAKPAGVDLPTEQEVRNMWNRNPDGAGLMYALGGKVHIEKGFMDFVDFRDRLDALDDLYGLKNLSVVMHFRITTHGGTKPENCHPFPISESIGKLKKLRQDTKIGVAHNGIIPVTPRKDISDTMEYIASQLAPLYRAVPKFYKNKDLMQMILAATDSKLAFLTADGNIYTVGHFIVHNGIMYSNDSYEHTWSLRDYCLTAWEGDEWNYDNGQYNITEEELMWLDEDIGEHVVDDEGKTVLYADFAIDRYGMVYEYFDEEDAFLPCYGYAAYSSEGMALKFDEKRHIVSWEVIYT